MAREDDWYKQALRQHKRGDAQAAFAQCQKVLARKPQHLGALCLCGRLQMQHGAPGAALPFLRKAVESHPKQADVHYQAGLAAQAAGLVDEAVGHLRQAVALDATLVDAWHHLGVQARDNQRMAEAVTCLKTVASARPNDVDAQRELAEALQSAAQPEAIAAFEAAISLAPKRRDLRLALVAALTEFSTQAEAENALAPLLEVADADAVSLYADLGAVLQGQYQYRAAVDALEKALALDANNHTVRFAAALALDCLCDFAAARDHYARITEGDLAAQAQNNRLFTTCYDPDLSPKQVHAEHQAWGDALQHGMAALVGDFANAPDSARPLRVGYLSPDFRKHPVSSFVASMIAFHHPSQVVAHCYANVERPDEVTQALKQVCPRWRDVTQMDDLAVADAIRADGIDILVDLAGLSGRNRLRVLSHRPAPIQVSYLGYPATTGLPSVDYRLTDVAVNPAASQRYYSERLAPIERGFCCYMPPPNAPGPGPLPALANGHVTFGSLVNLKKVNHRSVALWAAALKALPNARLALIRHTLRPAANRNHYLALFAQHGIGPERLDFIWQMPQKGGYLAHYQRVDVVLDTVPFCGHTSSCEALWMGVPILTLAGDDFAGRMGAGVMGMVGLDEWIVEWIAESPDDFAERAVRLTADLPALADLRAGLRQRMGASPLLDAEGFTRSLENAYRKMWQGWCASR